ncbi:MAG: hypothetical protein KDH20_14970 [Rhodocyclaceae bacterium]|nr:hypothetical protein [Rhodocyclaceae bacterium]
MREILGLALVIVVLAVSPITSAAEHTVTVRSFAFEPNDLTIQVGDTVTFVNQGGFHDVKADDGSFGNTASSTAWTFSRTFTSAGEVRVYCSVHSVPGRDINSGMNARITVAEATPAATFQINQGISGSWYDPNNPGQGFLIDVDPTLPFIFVAWFTFDLPDDSGAGSSSQLWLSGGAAYSGGSAEFDLLLTAGGQFAAPSGAVTNTTIGTGSISFTSCTEGVFAYQITNPPVSGSITLSRLLSGGATLCEQLQ